MERSFGRQCAMDAKARAQSPTYNLDAERLSEQQQYKKDMKCTRAYNVCP